MSTIGILVVASFLGALYVASRRAITIVVLDVERGSMRVVRGGIVPPILADLREIVKSPPIERARIRVLRASGRAEVELSGAIGEVQAQRIRNVIGSVPLARLANALRK